LILGFAASGVDTSVVQLAGIAGAIAGGISMAAGEWISVTAQNDLIKREFEVEKREHLYNREHETEELAEHYMEQGLDAELATVVAEKVMANPATALEVHTRQELGVDPHQLPSPFWAAGLSFVCFLFGAVLPIIPWFLTSGIAAAVVSVSVGVVAAAVVGALIGRFAERSIPASIVRQVGIVLVACAVTFTIGQVVGVNLD
jgi:VIT1/CCC1 family predicted Fe2+/Mn2+ transporter